MTIPKGLQFCELCVRRATQTYKNFSGKKGWGGRGGQPVSKRLNYYSATWPIALRNLFARSGSGRKEWCVTAAWG